MVTMLGAAASGMVRNQQILDTVGNNVANVNTAAFKKTRAANEGRPMPAIDPEGGRLGVAETATDLIFDAGAAQRTENPLHFAINDDTFFRVRDFDGSVAYTRLGQLDVDASGNITAFRGRFLQPPVTLPEGLTNPQIDAAGVISVRDADGASQPIGQVTLVRFTNPRGLTAIGDGLYVESPNSGALTEGTPGADGFAALNPGSIEGSNVEIAEEFTSLIIAQRAYQASLKSFQVGDEMLALATKLTR